MQIHPTAIIEPGAQIHPTAKIGPYCYVGAQVVLGAETELISHVSITGLTTMGERNIVFPFASIGHVPQDLKYAGEESRLEIGDDNKIREYVTLQPGTSGGTMLTKVGNHCLLMASSHVAHDCIVGDYVELANNATLGGHVVVGDRAKIGGLAGVHQFVRIGSHAMIGGLTGVAQDVIPYGLVMGERGYLAGLNIVGLKRRGVDRETLRLLLEAYREMFAEKGTFTDRVSSIEEEFQDNPWVMQIIEFIRTGVDRPLCVPRMAVAS